MADGKIVTLHRKGKPMTQWFVDFDDTLVVGPVTWAFQHAFPALIRNHQLPYDPQKFEEAVLWGQQKSADDGNELMVLLRVFEMMGWSHELSDELRRMVFDEYVPTVFDDTLAFLERVKGNPVCILSNNNHAPEIAAQLGISHHFKAIFTPRICGDAAKKPQRAMWDYVIAQGIVVDDAVMVGDDPWSEGAFAERCGIRCCIVDRMKRFTTFYNQYPYQWVHSIAEIQVT
jgi:FMN phosphatase YigB (HAD superfamily)